jgi:hypothetical protein
MNPGNSPLASSFQKEDGYVASDTMLKNPLSLPFIKGEDLIFSIYWKTKWGTRGCG